MEKYIPDTSVIINGRFYEFIRDKRDIMLIIPEAVISEIEAQANRGLMIGFTAISELEKIMNFAEDSNIEISFYGKRPDKWQIEKAKSGEIDNIIRTIALETEGTLLTSDFIQYSIAKLRGVNAIFFEVEKTVTSKIEDFFDSGTMSVHLKTGTIPIAKKGKPGNTELVKLRKEPMSEQELNDIARDIIERARTDKSSLIDLDLKGATVIQLRDYRIVITRPPFSEASEITAVKPTVKLMIEDYNIDDKLFSRLKKRAEGILVSGAPGAGKSTFVQALAEMYLFENKVVKTMEKPRDLLLSNEITRYTALEGDMEKTGDILLLVRPDYTIFDEMRTSYDFKIYADLRMAGVGMVGVAHASRAIDAVQRLIGRVELGVIPQLVDTIIHIENGKIGKVYIIEYKVKVPTGMLEQDLARPVIDVLDFYTDKLEYEIYTYGEQIVVVPVEERKNKVLSLAEKEVERQLKTVMPDEKFKVEIVGESQIKLYVREDYIPAVIGKNGKNVNYLEDLLGLHIEVKGMKVEGKKCKLLVQKKKNHIYLYAGEDFKDLSGQIFAEDEYLFTAKCSKEGTIKVRENTDNANLIITKLKDGKELYFETI
ncbi:MAG: PINc/VapC family ATPase [Thermoplasmata archaeon]